MKLHRNFIMAAGKPETGFFVRGTGHFIINKQETVKIARHGEIFWCVDGTGEFLYNDKKYLLRPGQVFYYPPGSLHSFAPASGVFNYHWLSIDGPNAGVLFQSLGFVPGVMEAGSCPEDLFASIEVQLQNNIKESQLKALNSAFEILTYAVTPKAVARPLLEQIKDFIDKNYGQQNLDINGIAGFFQMHRVSLTRQFQEYFGVTPGKYLASVRIKNAIRMLGGSDITLKEAACKCGFNSADYLSKSLRKNTALPLRELKKNKVL